MSLCNRIPRLLTCNIPTKVLSISSNKFSTESDNLKISLNEKVSQRIYIYTWLYLEFRIHYIFSHIYKTVSYCRQGYVRYKLIARQDSMLSMTTYIRPFLKLSKKQVKIGPELK